MHSPVLVNYDPALEFDDASTDWEYFSDDFFDFESPKPKRRKVDASRNQLAGAPTNSEKLKLESIGTLPELSLGEPLSSDEGSHLRPFPTVIWKRRGNSPKVPITKDGSEEKVSILKDWRERFKSTKVKVTLPNCHQQVVAVVIQNRPTSHSTGDLSPTTDATFAPTLKGRRNSRGRGNASPSDRADDAVDRHKHPARKKTTPPKPPSMEPPEPVLSNAISSTKGRRRLDAPEKPTPPTKSRARRGLQKLSDHTNVTRPANSMGPQAADDTSGHKPTGRLTRKRKLSQAEETPAPEPIRKKTRAKSPMKENLQPKSASAALAERRSAGRT